MHKPSFWRGYIAGLGLMLALGVGTIYYCYFSISRNRPDAEMDWKSWMDGPSASHRWPGGQ